MMQFKETTPEHQLRPGIPSGANPQRRRAKLTALVAALCITTGGLGAGIAATLSGGAPAVAISTSASIDAAHVAAEVDPAVVDIDTNLDPLEGGGQAAGTGMIVGPSGEIVTNNHVVQGADTVRVTIAGHGSHDAAVVGTDPSADVAVLRVSRAQRSPDGALRGTLRRSPLETPLSLSATRLGWAGARPSPKGSSRPLEGRSPRPMRRALPRRPFTGFSRPTLRSSRGTRAAPSSMRREPWSGWTPLQPLRAQTVRAWALRSQRTPCAK